MSFSDAPPTLSVPLTPQSASDNERTCVQEIASKSASNRRRRPAPGTASIVERRRALQRARDAAAPPVVVQIEASPSNRANNSSSSTKSLPRRQNSADDADREDEHTLQRLLHFVDDDDDDNVDKVDDDDDKTQPLQSNSPEQDDSGLLLGWLPPHLEANEPERVVSPRRATAGGSSVSAPRRSLSNAITADLQQAAQPFTLSATQSGLQVLNLYSGTGVQSEIDDVERSENVFDLAPHPPPLCVPPTQQVAADDESDDDDTRVVAAMDDAVDSNIVADEILVPNSEPPSPSQHQQESTAELSPIVGSDQAVQSDSASVSRRANIVIPPTQSSSSEFEESRSPVVTLSTDLSLTESSSKKAAGVVLPPLPPPPPSSTAMTTRHAAATRSRSPSFSTLALLFRHGVIGVGTVLVYRQHRATVTKDQWLDSEKQKYVSLHAWLSAVAALDAEPLPTVDDDWHRFVQTEDDLRRGTGLTLADHNAAIEKRKRTKSAAGAVSTAAAVLEQATTAATTPAKTRPPSLDDETASVVPIAEDDKLDSPGWQKRPASARSASNKRRRRRSPSPNDESHDADAEDEAEVIDVASSSTATSTTLTSAPSVPTATEWHSRRTLPPLLQPQPTAKRPRALRDQTIEDLFKRHPDVVVPLSQTDGEVVATTPTRVVAPTAIKPPSPYSVKKRSASTAAPPVQVKPVVDEPIASARSPVRSNSASLMPPPPPVPARRKSGTGVKTPTPIAADESTDESNDDEDDDDESEVVVLGSDLTPLQVLELRQMAGRFSFEVVTEWSARVTHLVMNRRPGVERVVVRRTIKYLYALMHGRWVLEWAWVAACLKSSSAAPEAPFEVRGDESTVDGADTPRLMRTRNDDERQFFREFVVYVHSKLSPDEGAPPRDDIVEFLRLGGARFMSEPPSVSDVRRWTNKQRSDRCTSVLMICDDASLGARVIASLFNRAGSNLGLAPVIRYTWVLDCISAAQQLPLASYFCMPPEQRPVAHNSISV